MSKVVEETKMETRQARKTAPSANPGFPTNEGKVRSIVSHHVKSFDYLVDTGVELAVKDIRPMTVAIVDESTDKVNKLTYWMENPDADRPQSRETRWIHDSFRVSVEVEVLHTHHHCTQHLLGLSMMVTSTQCRFHVGDIPIMVGSVVSSERTHSETTRETRRGSSRVRWIFICNGIERCIRMLQVPRRNHVVAIERPSFANRGRKYTSKATMIRSVRSVRARSVRTRSARMSFPHL